MKEQKLKLSELLELCKGATVKARLNSDSFFEVFIKLTVKEIKQIDKDHCSPIYTVSGAKLGDFTTIFIWSIDNK